MKKREKTEACHKYFGKGKAIGKNYLQGTFCQGTKKKRNNQEVEAAPCSTTMLGVEKRRGENN